MKSSVADDPDLREEVEGSWSRASAKLKWRCQDLWSQSIIHDSREMLMQQMSSRGPVRSDRTRVLPLRTCRKSWADIHAHINTHSAHIHSSMPSDSYTNTNADARTQWLKWILTYFNRVMMFGGRDLPCFYESMTPNPEQNKHRNPELWDKMYKKKKKRQERHRVK